MVFRNVESIFSVLFASPPWSQDPRDYRNILDEFLSRGHACCLTAGSRVSFLIQYYRLLKPVSYETDFGKLI